MVVYPRNGNLFGAQFGFFCGFAFTFPFQQMVKDFRGLHWACYRYTVMPLATVLPY
jgi:hypothetical protein